MQVSKWGNSLAIRLPAAVVEGLHLKPGDEINIRVAGDREVIFGDVRIRVDPNFALAMHIDTDEANAANLGNGAQGFIDGIQDD